MRDLKPENLFVHIKEDGGFVTKVVDFGIAKVRDDLRASAGKRAAQTLNAVGTPLYMSPEQAKGPSPEDPPVGPSCDIWAVGMMAFELLTGDPYWTADNPMALLGQIFFAPMKPPSSRSPVLGTKFDHWFARSCDRNPANRWVSASKQFDALLDALNLRVAPSEIPESLAVQVVGLTRHLEELAVDEPSLYRIVNPKRDDSHDTLVGANRPGTVASSRDADSIPSAIAEAPTEKFDSKRHAAPPRDTVPDAPSEALLAQSREGSAPMPINDLPTEPFDPKKHRPAPGKTAPSLRDSSSPTPLTDAPTSALAPKSSEPATMPLGVLKLGQVAPSQLDPGTGQRDAASQQGAHLQAANRIPQWVVFVAGIGVGLLALLTRC